MQRFVENIEKTITSTPGILSSYIQKQFGPDNETVYLKGNLLFIDSSVLEIAIFANNIHDTVCIDLSTICAAASITSCTKQPWRFCRIQYFK